MFGCDKIFLGHLNEIDLESPPGWHLGVTTSLPEVSLDPVVQPPAPAATSGLPLLEPVREDRKKAVEKQALES